MLDTQVEVTCTNGRKMLFQIEGNNYYVHRVKDGREYLLCMNFSNANYYLDQRDPEVSSEWERSLLIVDTLLFPNKRAA